MVIFEPQYFYSRRRWDADVSVDAIGPAILLVGAIREVASIPRVRILVSQLSIIFGGVDVEITLRIGYVS
jgi:hypothetical protein